MKKVISCVLVCIAFIVVLTIVIMPIAFGNELVTLSSLKQVDSHPLYTMTYAGDYGFSDFLKTGAQSDRDIEKFVVKRLLKGVDIDLGIASAGCTAFTAGNGKDSRIYARNFDFDYAPAVLLKTHPSDGYASISMVNLAFAGYGEGYVPHPGSFDSFLTLAAPYLPFDGVNEKGVAMALLAVPYADPPKQAGRVMLNTTTAIRLVLDRAATVDEAVALLKNYNYYFSGGVECHYLISDASGRSVVVEFLDGDMKLTPSKGEYQAASNFIMYQGKNIGEGGSEFERYNTVMSALEASNGILSDRDALDVLSRVQIPGRTQWSLVYNQVSGDVTVCMGAHYDQVYSFSFDTR